MHLVNSDLRPVIRRAPDTIVPSVRPRYRWYPPLKFGTEWIIALVLLVPCLLVIGFCGLLVKLNSPGKAFYRQRRMGMNGRIFTMVKIRSMVENSEAGTGPVWSQPGDPRVTRIGRILRDTHLDELPQIWNVLRGEMSLVGPRPERPEIVKTLEESIPQYCDRLAVRPGLSGLAQVELPPDSDEMTVRKKLAYDLHYVSHVSPWLDVLILVSTALYLFSSLLKALCHALVRAYGRGAESMFKQSEIVVQEVAAPQTA
jgi:lipopolysaccharide/colanic/teichoic acid biosynthesis glycosyltransferase